MSVKHYHFLASRLNQSIAMRTSFGLPDAVEFIQSARSLAQSMSQRALLSKKWNLLTNSRQADRNVGVREALRLAGASQNRNRGLAVRELLNSASRSVTVGA